MYDELVKRLREHNGLALNETLNEAADAIEELSKLAAAIPHVCECCIGCEVESGGCDNAFVLSPKRAREYLNKPRWIPVTERFPQGDEDVLAYVYWPDYGDTAICYGHWHNGWAHLFNHIEGELIKHFVVTHWMPLPEPPKEE